MLNMKSTVSICEQQTAAIYIDCVTVWVILGKKVTKMCLYGSVFNF